ncbi:MAG: hypothetical protein WDN76_02450 [Alphaproteobacteria bacterium]
MKKLIAGALAVVTMAAVTISTAEARPYYGGGRYYSYDRHRGNGDAVAAGVAGLAIGAIIGSAVSQPRGYYGPRSDSYYGPAPRGYYEPRYCSTRDWVWDPYLRRNVMVERSYPC